MSVMTLARWLGPWASSTKAPKVASHDDDLDGMRVRIYEPRKPLLRSAFGLAAGATYLVAPGLHYAAADDPRMDRFCRVLAASGHLVVAPFIPAYLALTPNADAIADFIRVADALPRWSDDKPVVFSISFGSLLAFALAAERPELVERLVVFGGYADFRDTLRFGLTGEVGNRTAARDPLNQPVVLLNLLDHIAHDPALRPALEDAWRAYVVRVWGRMELKAGGYLAIGDELAPSVPAGIRTLYRIGIGLDDGAWPLVEAALVHADAVTGPVDPAPYLERVRCRVDLVHGADDDVIPFEQSHVLAAALPNADVRVHVTGLYGHTSASVGRLVALPRELVTMVRVLRVLA
jgi:pimeloyl-ACP methyl ester carboxylesterase